MAIADILLWCASGLLLDASASSGSLNQPERTDQVRCWPEATENDLRSNVGYRGVKRTRYAHAEFCRS
jgi:hypothetical protein